LNRLKRSKLSYDRRSVGQSVLVSDHHLAHEIICFPLSRKLSSEVSCFSRVWHPLWRGDESVIYSCKCYWALSTLSLSGPSAAYLETISYSYLGLDSLSVSSYDYQGYDGGILCLLYTGLQGLWCDITLERTPQNTPRCLAFTIFSSILESRVRYCENLFSFLLHSSWQHLSLNYNVNISYWYHRQDSIVLA
jgi:hypothetical protein